jgi:hypothetical protein
VLVVAVLLSYMSGIFLLYVHNTCCNCVGETALMLAALLVCEQTVSKGAPAVLATAALL